MSVIGPSLVCPPRSEVSATYPTLEAPDSAHCVGHHKFANFVSGRSHIPLAGRALPLAVILACGGKLDLPLPAFVARLGVSGLAFGPPALGDDRWRLVPDGLS